MLGALSTAPVIESWQEAELIGRDAAEKIRLARSVDELLTRPLTRETRKKLAAEWRSLIVELEAAVRTIGREPSDIDLGWIPDYLRKAR